MMKGSIYLSGEAVRNGLQAGIGAALREAMAISDQGDEQMRRLIEQMNQIPGTKERRDADI